MTVRPRRSMLYMPGSNARAMEKARELPTDAVIFDLEDAVAPDAKAAARALIVEALKKGGFGHREVLVRINGLDTAWWRDDLAVAAAGPNAVLVPKISTPEQLREVAKHLVGVRADANVRLWAMMETPLAVLHAEAIAAAAKDTRLVAFVMGTNDLAKETRTRIMPGRAAMLPWLMNCIAAARAHGVEIIDGVYNDLGNAEGFARECAEAQSKDFGIIATEDGWSLFVGGNGGFRPRHADLLLSNVDTETLIRTIDRYARKLHGTFVPLEQT